MMEKNTSRHTVCTKPVVNGIPQNGHFNCESPILDVGSSCVLKCDPGFIPELEVNTTCQPTLDWLGHPIPDQFEWNRDIRNDFKCVEAVTLVVGGMDRDLRYISAVNLYAPGHSCDGDPAGNDLLEPLFGSTAAFFSGQAVICGGAVERYEECEVDDHLNAQLCNRNTDCVQTATGGQWCTGPKVDQCLVFDKEGNKTWVERFQLRKKRAFAASVILPDGRLWILGGVSEAKMLSSTELIRYDKETKDFVVQSGPRMPDARFGHCATLTPDDEHVLVTGGFDKSNYAAQGLLFNWKTRKWVVKPYLMPSETPRMDHVCGTLPINGEMRAFVVGGGNHDGGLSSADFFVDHQSVWHPMASLPPDGWRSGALVGLGGIPHLLGGVECTFDDVLDRQRCERSARVWRLDQGLPDDPDDDAWEAVDELPGGVARSSHAVMALARDHIKFCP